MNTSNDISKQIPLVEVGGTLLSLNYIRDRALVLLGSPLTKTNNHSQHTKTYHTTIPSVEFERQNGVWSTGSLVNSESSKEALIVYLAFLLRAKQIKKGKKLFRWDPEEVMFVEVV